MFMLLLMGMAVLCLPPCHSSCLDCAGSLSNQCTSCDNGTLLSPTSECLGVFPVVRLQVIDGSPQTPNYITNLIGDSNKYTADPETAWFESIRIEFGGLPNNYQLQVRIAVVLNTSVADCTATFMTEDFFTSAFFTARDQYYTAVYNFSSLPQNTATLLFNYTNNPGDCP